MLPPWVIIDLGSMAMKKYSSFPKSPSDGLMSYPGHLLSGSGAVEYTDCRDAVSIFYSPSQLGYELKKAKN